MKAIFFNAKQVLYTRPDPHQYLRAFLEAHGLQIPSDQELKKVTPDLKNMTQRGRIVVEVYSDAILKACGVTNTLLYSDGEKAIERDRANILIVPGVIPTLETLRKRGFKMGIITDSSASRELKVGWMRAKGLDIDWDAYANSRDVQAVKPDISLYNEAMRQAGVTPAESVYVGYHQRELTGAKRVGMTTVGLLLDEPVEADYTLAKIEDLLELSLLQIAS